jgi:hypothetical protein
MMVELWAFYFSITMLAVSFLISFQLKLYGVYDDEHGR